MGADSYLISVSELDALSGVDDCRVIDCRFELLHPDAGRKAYLEAHIPGAVYLDLDRDLAAPATQGTGRHPLPDPERLSSTLGTLGIDHRSRVVLYDGRSGALAARAWWLLRWLGHKQLQLLDGGLEAWTRAGYGLESGPVKVAPRTFEHRSGSMKILTSQEIVRMADKVSELKLVDARDRKRFLGIEETIDPVAGHIPGARNLPFSENLDDKGLWRAPGEIAARFLEAAGVGPDDDWSVMCGSGVTACHLVVAGLIAGLREPRLYVGSWSDWITDSSRPVAIGDDSAAELT